MKETQEKWKRKRYHFNSISGNHSDFTNLSRDNHQYVI